MNPNPDPAAAAAADDSPLLQPHPTSNDDERLALAWAVKDLAYAALYSHPTRVERALQRLAELAGLAGTAAVHDQIQALHDWLSGAQAALRGQAATAVERLDAAYAGLLAVGRTREAAASQVPKLIALALLGRHDEALACGERTHAQLVAAGDEAAAGRVEINLGSMLLRRHRYADAASCYRQAAVRFARVGDTRHSVMADIGLAGALSWQLEFEEAALVFDRAAARVRLHGLDALQATVEHNRGLLALRRGRHGDALRWLTAALRAYEVSGAPQPQAEARRGLADAYLAVNLLPEAVALYDQAISACREHPAATEEAWATMQRAQARAALGHDAEAARDLVAARELFLGNGHPVGAARAASHAAALALKAGLAQRALTQATDAARELAAAGLSGWAEEAEMVVARALLAQAQPVAAERLLGALLQREDLPLELRAQAQQELARMARARGDRPAERQALEAAAAATEGQRAMLAGDEFRTAWAQDKQAPFEALLGLVLDELSSAAAAGGKPAPLPEALAERLLQALERGRAAALLQGRVEGPRATDPDHTARQQLGWLRRQWQQAVALGQSAAALELAARLQLLEAQVLESQRRADAARGLPAAGPAAGEGALPLLTLAAAQARLADDAAVVAYGWAGQRLVALVLRRRAAWAWELDAAELPARVEQLRFQIDALRFGATTEAAHLAQLQHRAQTHLQALHRRLWAPLRPALEGAERVLLVPSGALHYVPFAALHDGEQALLDRHTLRLAPGVALGLADDAPAAAPRRALALGVAGDALPHVTAELAGVAQAFGPGARVLSDDDATAAALRAALPGVDVLHLACHGQFRADSPYFSSLQLADGPLLLRDAAALPLQGVNVVLSACETALSRVTPGDELLGLVRGFLLAGAPGVLATQWTVDDAGTAQLMQAFYAALTQGVPAARALRQAQQALRARQPHPYFWAPFVLYGRG